MEQFLTVLIFFQALFVPALLLKKVFVEDVDGCQALLAINHLPYVPGRGVNTFQDSRDDRLVFYFLNDNGLQAVELSIVLLAANGETVEVTQKIRHLLCGPSIATLVGRNVKCAPIQQLCNGY